MGRPAPRVMVVGRDLQGRRQEMVASPWCHDGAVFLEGVTVLRVRRRCRDPSLTSIGPIGVLKAAAEAIDSHGQRPGKAGVQEEGAVTGAHQAAAGAGKVVL